MGRTDEVEFAASALPTGRSGRASGWRVRLVVGGWVVVLAGVTGVGLAGRDGGSTLALTPVVVEPVAMPSAAGTQGHAGRGSAEPRHSTTRVSASPHRSLGNDGLVGGLPFGDNVPPAD